MDRFILKYRLYLIPFIAMVGILLFLQIRYIFSYSMDIIGLEYYFVHVAQQILQHRNMYPNPELLPHDNCLYTPVYFYLYSAFIYISQYDITKAIHELFVVGRALSLFIVVAQIALLNRISKHFTPSAIVRGIIITVYSLLITRHMFAIRPDALKVLFFLFFLDQFIYYCFITKNSKHVILFLCSAILAVYTKQDIFILISICFAIAYYIKRNIEIIYFYLTFVFSCFTIYLFYGLLYGKAFIINTVYLNIQSVSHLLYSYNILFIGISLIRTTPLILLAIINYRKINLSKEAKDTDKFIIIASLLFFMIAHLSMCRAGSNLNYTYELAIFLALNITVYYEAHLEKILNNKMVYYLLSVCFILVLFLFNIIIGNYSYSNEKEKSYRLAYQENMKQSKQVREIIKNDYIFFPNTTYSIYYNNEHVVLGHDMHLDRFINLYTPLKSLSGLNIKSKLPFVSTLQFDENFKNGTIQYIGIENEPKSIEHVETFYPYYSPYKKVGKILIYQFTKKAHEG